MVGWLHWVFIGRTLVDSIVGIRRGSRNSSWVGDCGRPCLWMMRSAGWTTTTIMCAQTLPCPRRASIWHWRRTPCRAIWFNSNNNSSHRLIVFSRDYSVCTLCIGVQSSVSKSRCFNATMPAHRPTTTAASQHAAANNNNAAAQNAKAAAEQARRKREELKREAVALVEQSRVTCPNAQWLRERLLLGADTTAPAHHPHLRHISPAQQSLLMDAHGFYKSFPELFDRYQIVERVGEGKSVAGSSARFSPLRTTPCPLTHHDSMQALFPWYSRPSTATTHSARSTFAINNGRLRNGNRRSWIT